MSITLYLVRHGKTVFNTVGRLQGWSDSPLTPEGIAAAEELGKTLKNETEFDAAFASTSPRALETAQLDSERQRARNTPHHPACRIARILLRRL